MHTRPGSLLVGFPQHHFGICVVGLDRSSKAKR
ncbi:hypothetical protein CKAH01_06278 [Colletotrichum kahawae]|uniref:Uncharacterized protein n=1 Tax=Colletotrichum kahawae TaxID=34407 RepID=A0AAE0D499_COLKA|nr:hypothetical protein CKAH01_06278 [Colletotrichum kahawae]